jgi:hypothetical protein
LVLVVEEAQLNLAVQVLEAVEVAVADKHYQGSHLLEVEVVEAVPHEQK